MGNALPQPFNYHPAAVIGSLVAGSPAGFAKEDATPLPPVTPRRERAAEWLRALRLPRLGRATA